MTDVQTDTQPFSAQDFQAVRQLYIDTARATGFRAEFVGSEPIEEPSDEDLQREASMWATRFMRDAALGNFSSMLDHMPTDRRRGKGKGAWSRRALAEDLVTDAVMRTTHGGDGEHGYEFRIQLLKALGWELVAENLTTQQLKDLGIEPPPGF
jgi:hypothetical protein